MPPSLSASPRTRFVPYSAAVYRLAFGVAGDPIKRNHAWGVPPDLWAVDALAARAAGHPWRPTELPPQPAWTYRAAVRRLLRREEARHPGSGDPVLQLNYARQVAEGYAARRATVLNTERRLTAAVRDRTLPAIGIEVDTPNPARWSGPHVPIAPEALARPSSIIRVNGALGAGGTEMDDFGPPNSGPYFRDVLVDSDALRLLDPPGKVPHAVYVPVWAAITWRAFGRAGSRNLGSRPENLREPWLGYFEDWEEHALRMGGWAAILSAEAELKALRLRGRATLLGRREGTDADGQPTLQPTGPHIVIPAETFLNERWAFEPAGCMHEFPWDRVTITNGKQIQRGLWFFDVQIAWPELAMAWGADVTRETPDDEGGPVLTPQPFPTAGLIAPWVAASWRAFGTLDTPGHIISHRSFDGGTSQLPDESDAAYAVRQEQHRLFDAAEREVMDMLANRNSKAIGKPPAVKDGRQLSHAAARTPVEIPAITFLNREIAFSQCGGLVSRLPLLVREFDRQDLHGSDADPRFPLYYDVLVETAGLREAWNAEAAMPEAAPLHAPVKAATPTPPCDYTETGLAAWFILRVRTRRAGAAPPTEAEDFEAARAQFGDMPRDRFRYIRREKTPPEWRKPGPRRPRN